MKPKHLYLFIFCLLACTPQLLAQWVGGTISYKELNRTDFNYEIKLELYFDCNPNGRLENNLSRSRYIGVGIFDAQSHVRTDSLKMTYDVERELDGADYVCTDTNLGSCLIKKTFTTWRYIDPGPNGKIIAFQWGFRNSLATNLKQYLSHPFGFGTTNWVLVPPTPNSSATFNLDPVSTICEGAPYVFDHSATDSDGDSLVYFLTAPYKKSHKYWLYYPSAPPYEPVTWADGYNTQNQVHGAPKFSIDSKTGVLNFLPDATGSFVTCIGVREYRNGKLLTTTRREFMYTVVKCDLDLVAAFTTKEHIDSIQAYGYECSDTVQFVNRSTNAKSYQWDFGDPDTNKDTSSLRNPTYVYPRDGDYMVTLKVENGICTDDYSWIVRIRSDAQSKLGEDLVFCEKVNALLDTKTPNASKVRWNNGDQGHRIVVKDSGLYIATINFGQCIEYDSIHIGLSNLVLNLPPDTLICGEVDLTVDAGGEALKYQWNTWPRDTFRRLRIVSPGIYIVTASDSHCTAHDTIEVANPIKPDLQDVFYCNDFEHRVELDSTEHCTYTWSNGASTRETVFSTAGIKWVEIQQKHCLVMDSFEIQNRVVALNLGPNRHYCDSVNLKLSVDPSFQSTSWSTNEQTPTILVKSPGTYWVHVQDSAGCRKSDTISITLDASPKFSLGNDTTLCLGSNLVLGAPKSNRKLRYLWNTGAKQRQITINQAGTYLLIATNETGCTWKDSASIAMSPDARSDEIFVENAFTPNNDNLNELFPKAGLMDLEGYSIRIYDRWGAKVFDSLKDGQTQWDGTIDGKNSSNQTYFYQMEYWGCDGTVKSLSGTIRPIR